VEVVRNRAKKHVFRPPPHFLGEDPQILDLVFKIASISDHVAKFCGDRPRDRGDLVLNKKERKKRKKETSAKHDKARLCVITQRAALISGSNHSRAANERTTFPVRCGIGPVYNIEGALACWVL